MFNRICFLLFLQNEVTEDIVCKINIESYQILNDEYHLRTFDFPVILLCKPCTNEFDYKSLILENLFLTSHGREDAALKMKVAFRMHRNFKWGKFRVFSVKAGSMIENRCYWTESKKILFMFV